MKLSILIPHTTKYYGFLERLESLLIPQLYEGIEVLKLIDNGEMSIGAKRNELLQKAQGEYLCFIDSDDRISDDYIDLIMEGIDKGVDCCSLTGEITFDNKGPKPFIHSIKHDKYWEDTRAYYRYPNHLNTIRTSIAKQFSFPLTNHGEDTAYATQIFRSKVLKTEHEIKKTIYYYDYRSQK